MVASVAGATTNPTTSGDGGPRPRRADAQHNRQALVEAATTVFARSGVDVPAKLITDHAGVGVGTLYRHFPRRSDLVVAVIEHEINSCAAAATEFAARHRPWTALTAWIDRLTEFVGTKRGLATALHSGDPAYDDLPRYFMDRLEPAASALLAAARKAGQVRAAVTARELLLTIALMCQPVPGESLDFNERMIRVFVKGLRQPTSTAR